MIETYTTTIDKTFYRFNEETGKVDRQIEEISYAKKDYTIGKGWRFLLSFSILSGLFFSLTSACLTYTLLNWYEGFCFLIFLGWFILGCICYFVYETHIDKLSTECEVHNRKTYTEAIQYMVDSGWVFSKEEAEEERDEYIKSLAVLNLKKQN